MVENDSSSTLPFMVKARVKQKINLTRQQIQLLWPMSLVFLLKMKFRVRN
jgi:hypothetical protein